MDIETEVLSLSVTKQVADALRLSAKLSNSPVDNVADRAMRLGLGQIADALLAKVKPSKEEG